MKRQAIYSVSPHKPVKAASEPSKPTTRDGVTRWITRHERIALMALGAIGALIAVLVYDLVTPAPETLSQAEVEETVTDVLESQPEQPPMAAPAYEMVRPSVVRVRRLRPDPADNEEVGVGTGVVLETSGVILTNLHVVAGADRLTVVFADGFETEAQVVGAQPENDLAVIEAAVVPDWLVPATLAGSAGLRPGDDVVAVGTPFGIGTSVSAGVVSGLGRSYYSPEGERLLTDLIQFDAAVNPGNSGGPLVNRRGEVVGIVTAIYNPTMQRVFVGIGFAVPIETAASAAGISPF
jgi:S1-C subfamily serine protease